MGVLTPGYWGSSYWASNYWTDDYWGNYGASTIGIDMVDTHLLSRTTQYEIRNI